MRVFARERAARLCAPVALWRSAVLLLGRSGLNAADFCQAATNPSRMHKGRLEAFSDGVIAIIITIMVLELKAPEPGQSLQYLWPTFLSYVLSFVYVGIYWNNHHHLLQASRKVAGTTLWANLHLLFWLSLVPFVTSWMGNSHFASQAVAAYGFVLLMSALAWMILSVTLRRLHGPEAAVSQALNQDRKEKVSAVLYLAAIGLAFWLPAVSCLLYCLVAALWFVPDRRLESAAAPESADS